MNIHTLQGLSILERTTTSLVTASLTERAKHDLVPIPAPYMTIIGFQDVTQELLTASIDTARERRYILRVYMIPLCIKAAIYAQNHAQAGRLTQAVNAFDSLLATGLSEVDAVRRLTERRVTQELPRDAAQQVPFIQQMAWLETSWTDILTDITTLVNDAQNPLFHGALRSGLDRLAWCTSSLYTQAHEVYTQFENALITAQSNSTSASTTQESLHKLFHAHIDATRSSRVLRDCRAHWLNTWSELDWDPDRTADMNMLLIDMLCTNYETQIHHELDDAITVMNLVLANTPHTTTLDSRQSKMLIRSALTAYRRDTRAAINATGKAYQENPSRFKDANNAATFNDYLGICRGE